MSVFIRHRMRGMCSANVRRELTTRTPCALSHVESSSGSSKRCPSECMYRTYGASEGALKIADRIATCTSWMNVEWRAKSSCVLCGRLTHMNHAVVARGREALASCGCCGTSDGGCQKVHFSHCATLRAAAA